MIEARADVVGSLLRPPELLEARERVESGELPIPEFKAVEDAAVDHVLALQEEAGMDVVTDGEVRRLSFQSQLTAAVEGFGEWGLDAFLWGNWQSDELGPMNVERPPIAVVEKLRRRRSLSGEELVYARRRTTKTLKVTLPSPSLFANFWDPERSTSAYATLEEFLGDVAEILREEADELAALGATYLQLDAPQYPLLVDEGYKAFYESRGWPAKRWLELGLELDNHVIADRPGVTFGFHLCRGNQASRWLVSGGYDWLADASSPPFGPSGSCSSTTMSAPAASSRSPPFRRTRWWCSAWSRRRRHGARPPASCRSGSTKRRSTSHWSAWPSLRNAGSPPPWSATPSPRTTSGPS